MHTFTSENQLCFNKTFAPNFNLPRDQANQCLKFHTNRELTSVPAEKIVLLAIFFAGNFAVILLL